MQKAAIAMQGQILDLRDKLSELKQTVIEGCKNAVDAFLEKGISALDNIVRFFKVRPILESMRNDLNENIRFDDGWGSSTIVNILKKRGYLGNTVNFKTRKHFKDKKSHYLDESQWFLRSESFQSSFAGS